MREALSFLMRPAAKFDGVRPLNLYALRLVYALMFFVLGKHTWTHILVHHGPWEPTDAVAWSLWTAFATLAGLGLLHPLRMIPILLLEIFYKLLWLWLVAYPLWRRRSLDGSPAASTPYAFAWVLLPILAMPWAYAFQQFLTPAVHNRLGGCPCQAKS